MSARKSRLSPATETAQVGSDAQQNDTAIPGQRRATQDELPLIYDGDDRKAEGLDQADAGTDDWWRSCCDAGIAELARRGQPFQAVDLLDLGVPEPSHPNRWGPRLHAAARAGVIEPVGYGPSRRATTACSAVRVWIGRND